MNRIEKVIISIVVGLLLSLIGWTLATHIILGVFGFLFALVTLFGLVAGKVPQPPIKRER